MPKLEEGTEEDKNRSRNRGQRLLQEFKVEHAKAIEVIGQRLLVLEQQHSSQAGTLTEHFSVLTTQAESLSDLKSALAEIMSQLEEQRALFEEQSEKLQAVTIQQGPIKKIHSRTGPKQPEAKMSDTVNESYRDQPQVEDWSKVSWSAIIFGTLAALAISIMLHVLGLGVTASSVDTSTRASDALALIGGVTGIWFLASTAISQFIGGFIASTLAHTFTGKRAAIYGIGVWALSTLLTMSVVVPALVKGAGAALTTGGTIIDRAGTLLANAGGTAVQAGQNAPSGLVETLQRSLVGTPSGQVDQAAAQDITRLLGQRFTQGEWSPQQRDQLVQDVAKVANIAPDDARRRVDEAQNTINATIEQAKQKLREAAEATRQAISTASYSAFAAMIIGLLFAFFGAHYGELDEDNLPPFARIRFRPSSPRETA